MRRSNDPINLVFGWLALLPLGLGASWGCEEGEVDSTDTHSSAAVDGTDRIDTDEAIDTRPVDRDTAKVPEDVAGTGIDTAPDEEPNDWYPCVADGKSHKGYEYGQEKFCPSCEEVPPDQCQGHEEWDKYEGDEALVERGRYIVEHLAYCVNCHSPGSMTNRHFEDGPAALAGHDGYIGWEPGDDILRGGVKPPNLTPHPTGLGTWTPEQVRRAFTRGLRGARNPDWPVMHPKMPYWTYANMDKRDQDAILAYLHQRPPVEQSLSNQRQPMPEDSPWRILDKLEPTDVDGDGRDEGIGPLKMDGDMPEVTLPEGHRHYEQAKKGKYLVTISGCAFCHTQIDTPDSDWTPEEAISEWKAFVDPDKLLAGKRTWSGDQFGGGWPPRIYSQNITGHDEHGVGDWRVLEVATALKRGLDRHDEWMCPPMPAGIDSAFSGMTDEDVKAIGRYLVNSEPNEFFSKSDMRKADGDPVDRNYDCKPSPR